MENTTEAHTGIGLDRIKEIAGEWFADRWSDWDVTIEDAYEESQKHGVRYQQKGMCPHCEAVRSSVLFGGTLTEVIEMLSKYDGDAYLSTRHDTLHPVVYVNWMGPETDEEFAERVKRLLDQHAASYYDRTHEPRSKTYEEAGGLLSGMTRPDPWIDVHEY